MNVTAVYEIRKTGAGFKALRQGNLSVLPPDFDPHSDEQLPPKLQVLRTMLERNFGKFLTEELTPKNLVVPVQGREPMELQLTGWETTRGWLVLAFKQSLQVRVQDSEPGRVGPGLRIRSHFALFISQFSRLTLGWGPSFPSPGVYAWDTGA